MLVSNVNPVVDCGNPEEEQYLQILRDIRDHGVDQNAERTGVGTREVFGRTMRFSLAGGRMPILTTKRIFWKTAFKEMLWMLSGGDNIRPLLEQNVSIWTDWPHQRYEQETGEKIDIKVFEKRILEDDAFAAQYGALGPVYGSKWRNWDTYEMMGRNNRGEEIFKKGPPIDQVALVLDSIKNNPGSRRHIFHAWDVAALGQMALPPCHLLYQFQVSNGRLNGMCFQRSTDSVLGLGFNIANLALITRLLAMHAGLIPGEIVWTGSCVHYYNDQVDAVTTQLTRTPRAFPTMSIAPRASIFDHKIEDFEMHNYNPHDHIPAPVAV